MQQKSANCLLEAVNLHYYLFILLYVLKVCGLPDKESHFLLRVEKKTPAKVIKLV